MSLAENGYRNQLNSACQLLNVQSRFEQYPIGPQHCPLWTVNCYINGIFYEIAAMNALNELRRVYRF
ncbi:hypothetical protein BDQ17DRAFT_1362370 [Cyathus striatus]|nr:hypothetical protein BDQ17DRAFT_1362370 [Cyathus striatus]